MMRLPKFNHISPRTIEEACVLREKYGLEASILAGGTDLLVACKLRIQQPSYLISLREIQELKGITYKEDEGLRIGAMSSLDEIRSDPTILKHYPGLSEAASTVGTPQLREMGTLGGNLCLNTRCIYFNQSDTWRKSRAICFKMGGDVCHVVPKGRKCFAVFSGDMAPILIALRAKIKLVSTSGERLVPVENLYSGDGKEPIALKSGELLSEIILPRLVERQRSIYLKYKVRGAIDFPLAGVAVRMDSNGTGICMDCRVVLNAVGSSPAGVPEAEELMRGKVPNAELIDQISQKAMERSHPVANTSGSNPTYRRKMVGFLTKRALLAVANNLSMIR